MRNLLLTISTLFIITNLLGQNQDCNTGITICGSSSFSNNASGTGSTSDFTTNSGSSYGGCLSTSGEVNSSWYYFSPTTVGTIAFGMTASPGNDYDFAIWGPFNSTACPVSQNPLRCSASDGAANNSLNTGLGNGAMDTSEDPYGDDWVAPIVVGAGDVGKIYIMCINKFSPDASAFNFAWTGTTASLDCTPLPILLISYIGNNSEKGNRLDWITGSEQNVDYFEISYSSDGKYFGELDKVKATGNSNVEKKYSYFHNTPIVGIGYYKLTVVGINGKESQEKIISIVNKLSQNIGDLYPNPNDGNMTLKYQLPTNDPATFNLTDLTGRVVYQQTLSSENIKVDLNLDLPKGMYYYKIIANTGTIKTGSVVVQK